MSKRKNKVLEDKPIEFTDDQVDTALQILHKEYFMQVLALVSHRKGVDEFTYTKVPMVTPAGGTYLISVLHVDGPKINLESFRNLKSDEG